MVPSTGTVRLRCLIGVGMDQDRALELLQLAERAEPHVYGPDQRAWRARLNEAADEISQALGFFLDQGNGDAALRLAGALRLFWMDTGRVDQGRGWLGAALDAHDGSPSLARARALVAAGAGVPAGRSGGCPVVDHPVAGARSAPRAPFDGGAGPHQPGPDCVAGWRRGRYRAPRPAGIEASGEDLYARSRAVHMLTWAAHTAGDLARARALFVDSLELRRRLGDRLGQAVELSNLGDLARGAGEAGAAGELLLGALEIAAELDSRYLLPGLLASLAVLAGERGDLERAARLLGASQASYEAAGLVPRPGRCRRSRSDAGGSPRPPGGRSVCAAVGGGPAPVAGSGGGAGARRGRVIERAGVADNAVAQPSSPARLDLGSTACARTGRRRGSLSRRQVVERVLLLVYVGTRCSHRPSHTSAPAAQKTSRTRYTSPRQRRNAQALARWPIDCSTSARSPACRRLSARCSSVSRSMVRRSPTGACQCWRVLASPRNPRSSRLGTSTPSSTPSSPASARSSCSWQLPGQPPSTHSRSPQTVDTDRPWAVWVCRLASQEHLLVGPGPGALHAGGQPVHADCLAGAGHLPKQFAQVVQGGDAGAVGLGEPERAKRAERQVQAVADLGLARSRPPGRRAGTTARPTPPPPRRPGGPPATVAGCRLVQAGVAGSGGRGDRPARPGPWRAARSAGSMTARGPDLQAGVSNLPMVWSPSMSGHTEHHGHPQ